MCFPWAPWEVTRLAWTMMQKLEPGCPCSTRSWLRCFEKRWAHHLQKCKTSSIDPKRAAQTTSEVWDTVFVKFQAFQKDLLEQDKFTQRWEFIGTHTTSVHENNSDWTDTVWNVQNQCVLSQHQKKTLTRSKRIFSVSGTQCMTNTSTPKSVPNKRRSLIDRFPGSFQKLYSFYCRREISVSTSSLFCLKGHVKYLMLVRTIIRLQSNYILTIY